MRLKSLIAPLLILTVLSCGSRRSEVSKLRVKEYRQNEWSRTALGDRVYISAPRMEPARPVPPGQPLPPPRDNILRETGENGAQLTVHLRGREFVSANCNCPPVEESGSEVSSSDTLKKEKQTERESFPWGWFTAGCVASFAAGAYVSWRWF